MATMTLPIRELELSVCVGTDRARAETDCVAFYSQARIIRPGMAMTLKLACTVAVLKFLLASLRRHQRLLIRVLQNTDFTRVSDAETLSLANSLDRIVEKGQSVLARLDSFGPRSKSLLHSSLSQLAEQLDHLASIGQSLHMECDPEVSTLLAAAVEQMVIANTRQEVAV